MSELLWQGLTLSLMGITLTFAALGLVIVVVFLLQRAFGAPQRDTEDEEIVAAIAVALAHLRSLEFSRSGLGASLDAGRGPWWATGRLRQQAGDPLRAGRRGPA